MTTPSETDLTLRKVVHGLDKVQRALERLPGSSQLQGHLAALDYERADIHLHVTSRHERKRAFACRKEPWTVAWIEELPADGVLWDVGANVGAYTLIAAMRPDAPLRVVSVEPSFSTYASLCRNVVLNEVGDRVSPLPVMLGAETGVGIMGYSDIDPGAAFHAGGAASLRQEFTSVYDQPVLTFALDDLVEQFGLPAPDYLKVDVDGAEVLTIRGARRSLADARSVLAEISNRERDEVDPLMAEAGLVASGDEHRRRGDTGEPERVGYVRYDRQ